MDQVAAHRPVGVSDNVEGSLMRAPASSLAQAIEKVPKQIQRLRELEGPVKQENTKAILINPILSALGEDLREIDEVRRQSRYKPQAKPLDYALFLDRTVCLFVEAKSLEKEPGDFKWIPQTAAYAAALRSFMVRADQRR